MAVVAPIEIVTTPKRYPPVGHCIYCGVYTKQLSKEHIIAKGLAGNSLILPKASCRDCAAKTSDWERACLRHMWWPFRTQLGVPSSGKQVPKDFTLRQMKITARNPDGSISAYDKIGETQIPVGEFPFFLMTYKLPSLGIVIGRNPDESINYEVVVYCDPQEMKKSMAGDQSGFQIGSPDITSFTRMLCKIAHAYAVAELGYWSFFPKLPRYIRGKALIHGWRWIGGDTANSPPEQHLHDIQWSVPTIDGVVYVMVSLRLFSFVGSPRYHIIVGELTRPVDQLPFLQQPLYTIDVKTMLPPGEIVPVSQGVGGTGP
jgi:hypothetical protein